MDSQSFQLTKSDVKVNSDEREDITVIKPSGNELPIIISNASVIYIVGDLAYVWLKNTNDGANTIKNGHSDIVSNIPRNINNRIFCGDRLMDTKGNADLNQCCTTFKECGTFLHNDGEKTFPDCVASKNYRNSNAAIVENVSGETPTDCNDRDVSNKHLSLVNVEMRTGGEKKFLCTVCPKVFCALHKLKTHMITHAQFLILKCAICDKQFKNQTYLNKHMICHTESMPFKCDECSKAFRRCESLKKHMISHSGVKQFQCRICAKQFTRSDNLKSHMLIHSGVKEFKCLFCPKAFYEYGSRTKHMKSSHDMDVKKLQCAVCKIYFIAPERLQYHMLITHGQSISAIEKQIHRDETRQIVSDNTKQFKCRICKEVFPLKDQLNTHKLAHTDIEKIKSSSCDQTLDEQPDLEPNSVAHEKLKCPVTKVRNRPSKCKRSEHCHVMQCEICGKQLANNENLKLHRKIHSGSKEFQCEVCAKVFLYSQNLRSHIQIHANQKEFTCETCGLNFPKRNYLYMHLQTHSDVKRFICEICQKRFRQRKDLEQHTLTHSGVRQFKCDVCGKAFLLRKALNVHMVNHTGLKRFKCYVCMKEFTQKHQVNSHMSTHTGIKDFKCEFCPREFAQRSALNKHLSTHKSTMENANSTVTSSSSND